MTLSPSYSVRPLPEKLLVAYTVNDCHNLDKLSKVTEAVGQGVNVLIWSFGHFHSPIEKGVDGEERIHLKFRSSQNVQNLRTFQEQLRNMGYDDVVHLASIGGWNAPHLPPGFSGEELLGAFQSVNLQFCQNVEDDDDGKGKQSCHLWDGFDWDLEGNDNIQSPRNEFTKECLDQMGSLSVLAKQKGLIVSMAPPESYLDITTPHFSRFVNLTYPDDPWHLEFSYHGANVYAYVLAKWGHSIDFVFLQFYESYSHAAYQVSQEGVEPGLFLEQYVQQLVGGNGNDNPKAGYVVNFEEDPSLDLDTQFVELPLSKLVFGFANGWAKDNEDKVIFFPIKEVKRAYKSMKNTQIIRGMGFYDVEEEGTHDVTLSSGLNSILGIRKATLHLGEEKMGETH